MAHERAPRDLEKSRHGRIEGGGWSVVTITRTGVGQSGSEEGAGAREFGGLPIDTPRFAQRNSIIPWTTTSNSPQPSPLSLSAVRPRRRPMHVNPVVYYRHSPLPMAIAVPWRAALTMPNGDVSAINYVRRNPRPPILSAPGPHPQVADAFHSLEKQDVSAGHAVMPWHATNLRSSSRHIQDLQFHGRPAAVRAW